MNSVVLTTALVSVDKTTNGIVRDCGTLVGAAVRNRDP
jgi:hypothetical protein